MGAPKRLALIMAATAVVGVTGCSSSSANDPGAVAKKYFAALFSGDVKTACNYVQPNEKAKCISTGGAGKFSGQNLKVHKVVTSGDRALVSVTGTICFNGNCQTVTDPTSGMPNDSNTFDQAWSKVMTDNDTAATPLQRTSGKWYIAPDGQDD